MTKPVGWCATWLPMIKLAQAICHFIVIMVFLDGRHQWYMYNAILTFSFLALFYSFFTILLRFFELTELHFMSFNFAAMLCNFVLMVLSLAFSGILIWDICNMRDGPHKIKYHDRLPPVTIGQDAWIRRCVLAASSLLLAGLLYLITYLKLRGVATS
ncbi:MARVEL domain-containing protein [Caenorhabditis elegans]|uniref:MARVEL domain-containing protein n=1 Tax=Caenorhabditis elegans TaxID=6239 RepID=O17220_CAEEL|nr:MARVEL domain-containing protein [Caenorhabditis elegans]CCD62152.1 MARVEL domain-containing protein [Caenorhabditis elegans]|eukprot:NP_497479.1 Uncharacterized protein CELE_F53A3.1 [Caenorhabditis elegans]